MSSGWSWPLTYLRVTDEYGMRLHPIDNVLRLHRGIDLYAKKNDAVYAAAVGYVSWAGYNGGEGNSVHVVHPDGSKTKYFHNTSLNVSEGQQVVEGELLAYAGTTGASTGVHVHFETHDYANRDSPVNPREFMAFRGAPFADGNYIPGKPNLTPEQIDEQEIDMTTEQILQGQRDIGGWLNNGIAGRLDNTVVPLLRVIAQRTLDAGEDLDAILEKLKTPVYQIKPSGRAAAIDEERATVKTYGSWQEWQNDVRQGTVSGTPILVDEKEFYARIERAKAQLELLVPEKPAAD